MDIYDSLMAITTEESVNTSNITNVLVSRVIIIQRLQRAVNDSQSPISQMGATYVKVFDEPMAPPEPLPVRTRPAPSTHDVWELILAVILAILVVAIARALQVRYLNDATSTTTTWFWSRPMDPD